MNRIIVRYKVKTDRAEENIQYIRAVFEQLNKNQPADLRYASFQLEDGVSFIHIASLESNDGQNPLQEMPEFQAFVNNIADRCEEPPVAMAANTIGAFNLFN